MRSWASTGRIGGHRQLRRPVALPRVAAHAAPQRDHREPAPPAGLQRDLRDEPRLALADTPIGAFRRWFARSRPRRDGRSRRRERPGAHPALLQQLGPTYVKIGQMMASRSDILPPELDRRSCPSSRATRRRSPTRTSRTSSRRSSAGTRRSCTPRSSTSRSPPRRRPRSIGRRSRTGRSSRSRSSDRGSWPRRRRTWASSRSWPRSPSAGWRSPARSASRRSSREFAAGVLKELDYRNEAYHARRLADGMARFPQVHVPTIYDDLSGQRVITMEFVKGIKISKADELREAGLRHDRARAPSFIRAIIKQVLVDGFFHGDPHPGNILARPGDAPDRLPGPRPGRPAQLHPADRPAGPDLRDQGDRHPGHRRRAASRSASRPRRSTRRGSAPTSTGSPASTSSTARRHSSARARGFLGAVFDNGLRLDSQLTLAIKAVVQAEETARALSPRHDPARPPWRRRPR